jgi:hypothetical protein
LLTTPTVTVSETLAERATVAMSSKTWSSVTGLNDSTVGV